MIEEILLAWRGLWRQPGLSAAVILTLALSIGSATAVFSLFDAVFLRPFPYRDAQRLIRVETEEPGVAGSRRDASLFDFRDWERGVAGVTGMAAYTSFTNNLTGRGPAQVLRTTFSTSGLFDVLGVQPLLGQTYTAADDQYGGDVLKAVLSHARWQELFGGRASAIGQTIQLRGQTYTVIGVMPPGFQFPDRTDVWAPLMARYSSMTWDQWWKRRDSRFHRVVARLRPGVSLRQASSQFEAVAASLARQFPDSNAKIRTRVLSLQEAETGDVRPYVRMVFLAVLLLLAIGSVNVANLLIARASSREREMALRAALGSSRWQLVRQLLTESLLYAVLGGLLGAALAAGGLQLLGRLLPEDLPEWMRLSLDARVLGFSLLAAVAASMLFGLAPAIHSARVDINSSLKQGVKGSAGGSGLLLLRRGLVVVEVALSLVLLVSAGLMLRSFRQLMAVDTGVKTSHLAMATVGRFVPQRDRMELVAAYANEYRRIRERLAQLPGVIEVSSGSDVPYLKQPEQRPAHEIYTRQRPTKDLAYRGPAGGADVMPGYFSALGIPLLAGRDFTEADELGKPWVIVISKYAAETLFPGRDPIGQQVRWGADEQYDPWMRVVGVVGNTKWSLVETQPALEVYWSYRQYPGPSSHMLLRTSVAPESIAPLIRRAVQEVNPDFSVERVKTMDAIVAESVWQRRLWGFVLGFFALVALGLAAIGLYGVMSYLASQRTREIGIRMALGASPPAIVGLVAGQGLALAAGGVLLGLGGAWLAARGLAGLLFGVSPFDPLTFAAVSLVMLAIAAVASGLPALRAAKVDPLAALRQD